MFETDGWKHSWTQKWKPDSRAEKKKKNFENYFKEINDLIASQNGYNLTCNHTILIIIENKEDGGDQTAAATRQSKCTNK